MKILKFVVEGYRSLESVEWRPGDLNVVHGPGASELQRATRLFSRLAQGWSDFADAMADEGATEAAFWHPEAIEVRMFALCAPHPDAELEFGHEVIVERLDARPWWVIGYERTTLSNDFELVDVLERMGDRIEYTPPRKRVPGMPVLQRAKSEVTRAAGDMASFNTVSTFRNDPRVAPHADAIERWSLHREVPVGEGSPARAAAVPFGFHGSLATDAGNLVNLLLDVCDFHDTRRALDRALRDVIAGYDELRFPRTEEGDVGMELRTRDGRRTPHTELSDATLRTLAVYGMLLSPEPPSLLWLDDPAGALEPWAAAPLAELALEAARRTQVVLSNPSPSLARRIGELARSPGETRRGGALTVKTFEV